VLTITNRLPWILAALFVLFGAVYTSTAFGGIDSFDGEMMFRVTESLVERHSLVVSDEIFHSNEPYAVYGLGTSLFAIPLYLAGKLLGNNTRLVVSLFNPIVTALTVSLLYYFALRLGFSRLTGLFLGVCFGLGSLAWPYTKTFFSEPLIALLLLCATYSAYAFRQTQRPLSVLALGLALGAGIITREDTLLVVPCFLLYLAWPVRREWRIRLREALLLLVPLFVLVLVTWWYHDLRFHSLLSGYVEKTGNRFDWTVGTFVTGVYGLLFSTGEGLVFFTPLALLSVLSWRHFWACQKAECVLFTFLVVERTALFAFLVRWYGGVCWGPRYIVPTIPFLILPIGFLLRSPDWLSWRRRLVVGSLFFISFLAQLPGVAVYYAFYWNDLIGSRMVTLDQYFFVPKYTPLWGQFRWMVEGKHTRWLLPVPPSAWEPVVRLSLLLVAMAAAATLAWLFIGDRQASSSSRLALAAAAHGSHHGEPSGTRVEV